MTCSSTAHLESPQKKLFEKKRYYRYSSIAFVKVWERCVVLYSDAWIHPLKDPLKNDATAGLSQVVKEPLGGVALE